MSAYLSVVCLCLLAHQIVRLALSLHFSKALDDEEGKGQTHTDAVPGAKRKTRTRTESEDRTQKKKQRKLPFLLNLLPE